MSNLVKNILVPLDGSDLATQALPYAEEIAMGSNAKLILLQVVETRKSLVAVPNTAGVTNAGAIVGSVSFGTISSLGEEIVHNQAMDRAKQNMDSLAMSLHYRKVQAESDIDTGDPAIRIIDYAASNAIDLIVMSTHGRTGVRRWTYGSVAQKVLQAAPCPVLIVRPVASSTNEVEAVSAPTLN